jgi:hypothetical protein
MRKQILPAATVIALAMCATTSAMALDGKVGHASRHIKVHHGGGMHGFPVKRSRSARLRSSERWRQGDTSYRGGFIDLGPLGITAACGSYRTKHGYCGPGYSVSAWTY